ncbi:hypothetical protein MMC14_002053 [Varicellaria rhodocarpa]|nr:hypothetical protein [Varicellaria rhodocarpa]
MRPSREAPAWPAALFLAFLLHTSFITAQALPKLSTATESAAASSSAQGLPKLSTATENAAASGSTSAPSKTTAKSAATSGSNESSTTSAAALTSLPALSSATDYDGITGAPKLSGAYSYPAPSVPPTADAPYMKKSTVPEGTVFICVGAVLGFFAMAVIAWRSLIAWSLHRSARRSANANRRYGGYRGDAKSSMLRNAGAPFYNQGPGSAMSLDQLGPITKGGLRSSTTNKSLFFSPTAGAGVHTQSNRGSGYLPAGYYAAGNSAAGGGVGTTHLGGERPISMVDSHPHNQGYQRARSTGPSPPISPSLPPSRDADMYYGAPSTLGNAPSTSTVNLLAPSHGTAPSDYLEDLFENYPPGSLLDDRGDRRRP